MFELLKSLPTDVSAMMFSVRASTGGDIFSFGSGLDKRGVVHLRHSSFYTGASVSNTSNTLSPSLFYNGASSGKVQIVSTSNKTSAYKDSDIKPGSGVQSLCGAFFETVFSKGKHSEFFLSLKNGVSSGVCFDCLDHFLVMSDNFVYLPLRRARRCLRNMQEMLEYASSLDETYDRVELADSFEKVRSLARSLKSYLPDNVTSFIETNLSFDVVSDTISVDYFSLYVEKVRSKGVDVLGAVFKAPTDEIKTKALVVKAREYFYPLGNKGYKFFDLKDDKLLFPLFVESVFLTDKASLVPVFAAKIISSQIKPEALTVVMPSDDLDIDEDLAEFVSTVFDPAGSVSVDSIIRAYKNL